LNGSVEAEKDVENDCSDDIAGEYILHLGHPKIDIRKYYQVIS
jgi:hypothetical protein